MNSYQYSYLKRRVSLVSTCLIMLLACSSLGSEEDIVISELTSDYVPSDLWMENGRELILQKEAATNQSTLFTELPESNLEVEITLDSEKELSKVAVPLENGLVKTLYFDYGRLCFSQVTEESGEVIISAYADGSAYAHALADGSELALSRIRNISLGEETLESLVTLGMSFSNREKKAIHNIRISESESTIADTVSFEKDFIVKMNLKKGEKVDIRLLSIEPHVYFTLSPGNGSDMEHRTWTGPAPFTGDLEIRVFAAEEIEDGSFRLNVKKY